VYAERYGSRKGIGQGKVGGTKVLANIWIYRISRYPC
jgi:hypothetical protein